MSVSSLIALLADGKKHYVTELANVVCCSPHQLNALWQHAPLSIRTLLRQRDGWWHLVRPVAWFGKDYQHPLFHTFVHQQLESSNDVLLQQSKNQHNIHQYLVIANTQTQGRGRQGKTWQAQAGECLMFSLGWVFTQTQAQLGALAAVVALSCHRALNDLGCATQIKWPNDLMCGEQKLAGILIETVRQNGQTHAIIGIGINFMQPETLSNATSFQAASRQHSAQTVLNTLLNALHQDLQRFAQTGFAPFQAAYLAAQRDLNQEVMLLHEQKIVKQGKVTGIANDGALLLLTEKGVESIVSGELSLRPQSQTFRQPETPATQKNSYLLFDAGNSRLKWAWIQNAEIIHTNHAPYRNLSKLENEWAKYGHDTLTLAGSAVCGDEKKELVQAIIPNKTIHWFGSMPYALGITNHYRNPSEHGADRWFNALGARKFSQNACVIVSCGTAVTIDALTLNNHYLGGTIMPGFNLMRESLMQKTAQLQRPEGLRYPFPTTTANAITTGIIDATCGAVMLMYERLKQRCAPHSVDVVITGGGAAKVANALPKTFVSDNNVKVVDNLVIYGLLNYLVHNKHQRNVL